MILTNDDKLISEQIIQDLTNKFNNLTQDEKRRFFNKILNFKALASSSLLDLFTIISVLIYVYRKYSEKHPNISIEDFAKSFLKNISVYDDEWMNNFLPFCLSITEEKNVGLCGLKSIDDCKNKIISILDNLLPF